MWQWVCVCSGGRARHLGFGDHPAREVPSAAGRHDDKSVAELSRSSWRPWFPLTPEAIYEGFVKNMRDLTRTLEAEDRRRTEWLSVEAAVPDAEINTPAAVHGDKYGCDPDFYLRPSNTRMKPPAWKRAVQCAGIVHIDEMRTLLVLLSAGPAGERNYSSYIL